MTVVLKEHKLFYAAIPKVACSSIKTMFYEIENGFAFKPFKTSGRSWYIHDVYPRRLRQDFPTQKIADYRRLALVRDPIKRFLSAYGNRVVHHKEASQEAVDKLGGFSKLTPNPDLGEFVDRMERYMKISSLAWHCKPMTEFIGTDASYFHGLYSIQQMDGFLEDVSGVIGKQAQAPRLQTGGPKLSPSDLTAKQTAKLEKFYRADYQAFSRFF